MSAVMLTQYVWRTVFLNSSLHHTAAPWCYWVCVITCYGQSPLQHSRHFDEVPRVVARSFLTFQICRLQKRPAATSVITATHLPLALPHLPIRHSSHHSLSSCFSSYFFLLFTAPPPFPLLPPAAHFLLLLLLQLSDPSLFQHQDCLLHPVCLCVYLCNSVRTALV